MPVRGFIAHIMCQCVFSCGHSVWKKHHSSQWLASGGVNLTKWGAEVMTDGYISDVLRQQNTEILLLRRKTWGFSDCHELSVWYELYCFNLPPRPVTVYSCHHFNMSYAGWSKCTYNSLFLQSSYQEVDIVCVFYDMWQTSSLRVGNLL